MVFDILKYLDPWCLGEVRKIVRFILKPKNNYGLREMDRECINDFVENEKERLKELYGKRWKEEWDEYLLFQRRCSSLKI
jgi:hypothetical protein